MVGLGVHVSNHRDINRAIDVVQAAERAGIGEVWIAEDLYYYGAVPLAAAVACRTTDIGIGFGVLTPYGRHPGLLAMDLATLIELAPGRLKLGIGAGVQQRVQQMGDSWQDPVRVVDSTVQVVQRLLAGETVDDGGLLHCAADLRLTMARPPGALPTYVAAMGPKALRQAGARFDGVLLSTMCATPYIEWAIRQIDAGRTQAARTHRPTIVASFPLRLAVDPTVAIGRAKRDVARFMTRWARIPPLRLLFTDRGVLSDAEFDRLVDALERGGEPDLVVPDEIAQQYAIAGTVEDAVAQLRDIAALGVDLVCVDIDEDIAAAELTDDLRQISQALKAGV